MQISSPIFYFFVVDFYKKKQHTQKWEETEKKKKSWDKSTIFIKKIVCLCACKKNQK
jgi:hypothetical protein